MKECLPEPIDFTRISQTQLASVDDLVKKMTELSKLDRDYPKANIPNPDLQNNSVEMLKCLKDEVFFINNQENELKFAL